MKRFVLGLATLVAAGSLVAAERPTHVLRPSSDYEVQDIRGWKIHVHRELLGEQKPLGDEAIELLDAKLFEIVRAVPAVAVEKLREVPIWLGPESPAKAGGCYHPSRRWLVDHGHNPDKARAVELSDAARFLKTIKDQPAMVLHELAHGYHDRFLPDGYRNPDLAAAHRRAVEEGTYDQVLHYTGRKVRAYALENPMEYFAELSEAWFGTNDFYPFVRAELRVHDPEGAALLKRLWGEPSPE